MKTLFFQ